MARHDTTALQVTPRTPGGSREARRLRRSGDVPGVLYGGGDEPVSFQVSARTLRQVLAGAGAVLDLSIEGGSTGPVVVKELVRHALTGETVHLDLLRVRLDQKIQATVVLELTGTEDAPGVKNGGVLELVTRELTIEALPTDIPDSLFHDVSEMQINDTLTLESLKPPGSVTLVDDPETVIAILSPPRLQLEGDDEIEQETAIVGEGAAGEAEGDGGEAGASGDAGEASGDSDSE
jgi:large subunit ribosomal protein L25